MKKAWIVLSILAVCALGLAACENSPPPAKPSDALAKMREKAAAEAERAVTNSYEINNIAKRRHLFGKPGIIGYVVFLNDMGQPVQYLTVDGKCTSSNKRLTRGQEIMEGQYSNEFVVDAASEDGTYGKSDEYIYCFTPDGRYVQWSGQYLYSDKPFDLTTKPMVISVQSRDDRRVQGQ